MPDNDLTKYIVQFFKQLFYEPSCIATVRTRACTFFAPASFSTFAHSFSVAREVVMSSTRQRALSLKLWSLRTAKAPATFFLLCAGVRLNCLFVYRMRTRSVLMRAGGWLRPLVIKRDWLKPRWRRLNQCKGTGTNKSTSSKKVLPRRAESASN